MFFNKKKSVKCDVMEVKSSPLLVTDLESDLLGIGVEREPIKATTPAQKTLAEIIIDSIDNEPGKWTEMSDRIVHKRNDAVLYDGYRDYVSMPSDPAVTFTSDEQKKLYASIQKFRRNLGEQRAREGHKNAMARFGH